MKKEIRVLIFITLILAIPEIIFAAQSGQKPLIPTAFGAAFWGTLAIVYLSRRRAIGGWLLYFYVQLYLSLVVSLGFIPITLTYLNPNEWDSSKLYVFFLFSTIPVFAVQVVEVYAATKLLIHRYEKNLLYLKKVLIALATTSAVALIIDVAYFERAMTLYVDIITLIFAVIWLTYFSKAKRVRCVFIEGKWTYTADSKKRILTPEDKKRLRKRTVITSLFTFMIILSLMLLPNFSYVFAKISESVLRQRKAVVTIYVNDKNGKQISGGSGFIIDPSGIIATNFHILSKWPDSQGSMYLKMENGAYYLIEHLVAFDEENDIALLKVEGKELPVVKMRGDYKARQGDNIIVIGSPLGLDTTISEGIISNIRGRNRLIQISAPVSPGSSGSPVFNVKGEVIGVATFLIEGGQNLNFAIPVKHIVKLFDEYKSRKKKGKTVSRIRPQEKSTPTLVNPELQEVNLEKADLFFAAKEYDKAISEYMSIWRSILSSNKEKHKMPYIELQIAKSFIATREDMLAWSWLKYLIKEHSSSVEALYAKNLVSEKRWFYIGKTDIEWFIDFSSLTSVDNDRVRVLVKSVSWKGTGIYNEIYDCALGRWTIIGLIAYDSNGRIKENYDYSRTFEWKVVVPNSMGENLWKAACNNK
jgi:S1-C subfamily serine protease